MPYRLTHMLLASGLTAAFLIAGFSAFRWIVGDRSDGVRAAFRTGATLAAILIPIQIFAGDQHGLNTLEYQPAKVAAMEGHWDSQESPVPLLLFAIPDEERRQNDFEIGIPYLGSIILTHSLDGTIPGLDAFIGPNGEVLHPPVAPVFYSFRVMVGIGMLMLIVSWTAAFMMWRRGAGLPALPRPMLWAFVGMTFSGWIATLAGWYTTEIGRQPWLVQGVLSTEAAVADVPAPMVLSTLIAYLVVYAALLAAYVGALFYLARKAARGEPTGPTRPAADPVVTAVAAE
jgi:cytochrome d ubiquinol oxidase subunit I